MLPYIRRRGRWKFTDRKKHHGAGQKHYEISGFLFPFKGGTFFFFLKEKKKKALVAVMDGKDETLAR